MIQMVLNAPKWFGELKQNRQLPKNNHRYGELNISRSCSLHGGFPVGFPHLFFSGKSPRVTSAGRGDEDPSALPVALCAAGCAGTWRRQRHAWLNS